MKAQEDARPSLAATGRAPESGMENHTPVDFTPLRFGTNKAQIEPRLLRASELAIVLAISKSQAYSLMNSGVIPGVVRIGTSIRIDREAVSRWLDAQEEATS